MAIVTVSDLNNIINKMVSDLMGKGYILSNFTHGSCYYTSTEFYLDMIKPNDKSHILRIWMINSHADIEHKIYSHINTAAIRIKKYTNKDGFCSNYRSQTLWLDSGEVISESKFYQICEGKSGNVYTDNLDEAIKIINMQFDRRLSRAIKRDYSHSVEISKLPSSFIDSIMCRINAIRGFKRATASCITKVIVGKGYGDKMAADVYYSQNGKDGIIKLR